MLWLNIIKYEAHNHLVFRLSILRGKNIVLKYIIMKCHICIYYIKSRIGYANMVKCCVLLFISVK